MALVCYKYWYGIGIVLDWYVMVFVLVRFWRRIGVAFVGIRMVLVWYLQSNLWYLYVIGNVAWWRYGMVLVWYCYGIGMVLVWYWYGIGIVFTCYWYGSVTL